MPTRESPQLLISTVNRGIIDDDHLKSILREGFDNFVKSINKLLDILHLIVGAGNDAYFFQNGMC
jgi:hypothetical protein